MVCCVCAVWVCIVTDGVVTNITVKSMSAVLPRVVDALLKSQLSPSRASGADTDDSAASVASLPLTIASTVFLFRTILHFCVPDHHQQQQQVQVAAGVGVGAMAVDDAVSEVRVL